MTQRQTPDSPDDPLRKLGFALLGETEFEYPPGHWMRCKDWRMSLGQ